jgi:hypothetical protein
MKEISIFPMKNKKGRGSFRKILVLFSVRKGFRDGWGKGKEDVCEKE